MGDHAGILGAVVFYFINYSLGQTLNRVANLNLQCTLTKVCNSTIHFITHILSLYSSIFSFNSYMLSLHKGSLTHLYWFYHLHTWSTLNHIYIQLFRIYFYQLHSWFCTRIHSLTFIFTWKNLFNYLHPWYMLTHINFRSEQLILLLTCLVCIRDCSPTFIFTQKNLFHMPHTWFALTYIYFCTKLFVLLLTSLVCTRYYSIVFISLPTYLIYTHLYLFLL